MAEDVLPPGNHRLRPGAMIALVVLLATTLSGQGVAASDADEDGSDWSYSGAQGPEHWGDLAAAYETCKSGRTQSPVDIARTRPLGYAPLVFRYRSQRLDITNSGRGMHVIAPPGSALIIQGKAFDLEKFSFHVPGEHSFDGIAADAEIQLVHRDRRSGFVVVAVLLQVGNRENRILSRILDHFPMTAGERVQHRHVGINPIFLLPSRRSYFRYEGSLTTPPCTEPVLWYVLDAPLIISPGQLRRIAQAIGFNARPVQPLDGRVVDAMLR